MNAQNMLFRLVRSWTVQLALFTVHLLGYLCDNIGLILAIPSFVTLHILVSEIAKCIA